MKKPRLEELIMLRLYILKKDGDPIDWQTHVRHNLVPEVRKETIRFYGPIDCLESQYPGLNYSKSAHRLRLSHFQHHRRLFRVFDQLKLTDNEIQKLCKWEGTRYARETYEAKNLIIRDTTWEGVVDCSRNPTTASRLLLRQADGNAGTTAHPHGIYRRNEKAEKEHVEEVSEVGSDDEVQLSIGVELNQRLLAATEARARGEDVTIDADWEEWLKEAAERSRQPELADWTSAQIHYLGTHVHWDSPVPEIMSDNRTPEHAALQASYPSPSQDLTQGSSDIIPNATSILLPTPRTGTTL